MDEFISEIRDSAVEWRKGVHKLQNDYVGELESVHMTLTRLIEDTEELKPKIEREEKQQERKEITQDEQLDEDKVIEQTNYGERGKIKSRKQKKVRKERSRK